MSEELSIFKRIEKKYQLTQKQKEELLAAVGEYLTPDEHGQSTICSLYLDTPDHLLIRNSIDAEAYKEKLRLRSYGTPKPTSKVFLELKKKYKGVVYKRRVDMTLEEAEKYLATGEMPMNSQIMKEIDYAMEFYHHPQPAMMIVYEREAFYVKGMPNLRLTFDTSVRYRDTGLLLEEGTEGKKIISDDTVLLEIKTDGAMPVWLSHALDGCKIRPSSFSKYGTAYLETLKEELNHKGEKEHVSNL